VILLVNAYRFYPDNYQYLVGEKIKEFPLVDFCEKFHLENENMSCSKILRRSQSSLHGEAFSRALGESLNVCDAGTDCRHVVLNAIATLTDSFFWMIVLLGGGALIIFYFFYRVHRDKLFLQMISNQAAFRDSQQMEMETLKPIKYITPGGASSPTYTRVLAVRRSADD